MTILGTQLRRLQGRLQGGSRSSNRKQHALYVAIKSIVVMLLGDGILVPLALGLGLVGLLGFLWSLKSGQYDDLEGAAWRAIADDEPAHERRSD
jgi:cbb3-type cytochrome oxidase maturation protein